MVDEKEFLNSMEDFLMEAEAEELDIEKSITEYGLNIQDKSTANYFLKKINQMRDEVEEIHQMAKEQKERAIEKYTDYEKKTCEPLLNQIEYFSAALETFMRNEYDESHKKSIKLPDGILSLRKQQNQYEFSDATLDFLKDNNLNNYISIKTTESIDKKAIKKDALLIDGKLHINGKEIPGINVLEREDKFEIK